MTKAYLLSPIWSEILVDKVLFVEAIEMLEFDQETCIPTAIAYNKENVKFIGNDAFSVSQGTQDIQNEFKLALGNISPGRSVSKRIRFKCGDGQERSAYEISKDFFELVIEQARENVYKKNLEPAKQAIISEPLSFYQQEWHYKDRHCKKEMHRL